MNSARWTVAGVYLQRLQASAWNPWNPWVTLLPHSELAFLAELLPRSYLDHFCKVLFIH